MKALIIGGTGTISSAVVAHLVDTGWEVTLLNRGRRAAPAGVRVLVGDMEDEAGVRRLLEGEAFDAVADFIVFTPEQARRDIRLFAGKTRQYIFISSASAYQKPVPALPITEETPLINPYWQYSRKKAEIEALLMAEYRQSGLPRHHRAPQPHLRRREPARADPWGHGRLAGAAPHAAGQNRARGGGWRNAVDADHGGGFRPVFLRPVRQ